MKSIFSYTVTVACALAVFTLVGCQPSGPDANRAATDNANTPKEKPVDKAAIEKE
jgi:hypothetical protein